MQLVADLHLHSKYSRAVSQDMVLPLMAKWGRKKGLDILSACDFTHPLWLREVKGQLEEASDGLYKLKTHSSTFKKGKEPLFLLSTEISSIYSQDGRLRRIHNLLFAPNFETVEKINQKFLSYGANLSSDGRPIIGISSKNLLEMVLEIDRKILLIPCHIWTPHFGIYGSASGFDSLEEAFGQYAQYVYGIETGLSSDPTMNWQIGELNNRSILSFSDAHSPAKMGREATVFEVDKAFEQITYGDIGKAIVHQFKKERNGLGEDGSGHIAFTIEFYPEEGKYHYSGHRNCKIVRDPIQIKQEGDTCPVCQRRLTEGVLYRVAQLAKDYNPQEEIKKDERFVRWIYDPKDIHPPYIRLVPLNEIIAESIDAPVQSVKTKAIFDQLCEEVDNEIHILLHVPLSDIEKVAGSKVAMGIEKVRKGDIAIDPGFDGEYGKVAIWQEKEEPNATSMLQEKKEQLGLF